jgi:hypothetical protein
MFSPRIASSATCSPDSSSRLISLRPRMLAVTSVS